MNGRGQCEVYGLATGDRSGVGIAATILHKPKLVILDEPISGLDPEQIN